LQIQTIAVMQRAHLYCVAHLGGSQPMFALRHGGLLHTIFYTIVARQSAKVNEA
jgi:hypothetical protein